MDAGKLQEILDRSYQDLYDFQQSEGTAQRRGLSILPDGEREELDLYLSHAVSEEESEEVAATLNELESLIGDSPRALELLAGLREDLARTALRFMEMAYRFGKRRGSREALDLLLPYIQDKVTERS